MNRKIVSAFVDAINEHDVAKITDMLTDGHLFIDAHENHFQGKEMMKEAWKIYFQNFPDYKIEAEEFFENGNTVIVVGHASATVAEHGRINPHKHWKRPSVWKALVSPPLIQHWQVFSDTKIVYDLMEK
jgi:ketosteroid isomerase-like protein